MFEDTINIVIGTLAMVVVGAALLGVLFHFLKQPLIVAYIACGLIVGPRGLLHLAGWRAGGDFAATAEPFLETASTLGIIFLLFLAGMVLNPERLKRIVGPALLVTLASAALFAAAGLALSLAFGFSWQASLVLGLSMISSSTILLVKLLPVRKLHESPVGTLVIGVAILQDLLAVLVLLILPTFRQESLPWYPMVRILLIALLLVAAAVATERYLLRWLLMKIERYPELLFILGLAWCFAMAELALLLGLSLEIGAFLAGLSLARNPISLYIYEKVTPLRDFFIVLFFFVLGARLDLLELHSVILPAAAIALVMMVGRPALFYGLFRLTREQPLLAREASVRLSALGEFGLLIAALAMRGAQITSRDETLIEVICLLTMIASTYWVVNRYTSPLAVSTSLKQN